MPDSKAAEASGGEAPQRSRLGRAAAMTGYTALNLASAPLADAGRRLSGQGSRHGLAPWRMSADLANRARLLRDDKTSRRHLHRRHHLATASANRRHRS